MDILPSQEPVSRLRYPPGNRHEDQSLSADSPDSSGCRSLPGEPQAACRAV